MNLFETKFDDVEHKAASGLLDFKSISEDGEFEGFGAIFGNIDRGRDKIMPGAFDKTLKTNKPDDIKLLRSHDGNKIVGEWKEIKAVGKGLYSKGQIYTETDLGKETLFLMRKKQLSGLSIGYQTIKQNFMAGDGKKIPNHRELLELMLFEISVVTFAMNPKAGIARVKSDFTERDVENALRDAGAPSQFAKMVAIHGFQKASDMLGTPRDEGLDTTKLMDKIKSVHDQLKGK